MAKKNEPEFDIDIYNEEQRWWAEKLQSHEAALKHYEDLIKLTKAVISMCEAKIAEFKE